MKTVSITASTDPSVPRSSGPFGLTVEGCKANLSKCLRLRNTGKISERRTTVLMAMATSWIALANQITKLPKADQQS